MGGSESLKNDNDRRKDINIQGKDILKTMYIWQLFALMYVLPHSTKFTLQYLLCNNRVGSYKQFSFIANRMLSKGVEGVGRKLKKEGISLLFLALVWFSWLLLSPVIQLHTQSIHSLGKFRVPFLAWWPPYHSVPKGDTVLPRPYATHLSTLLRPWLPQYVHLRVLVNLNPIDMTRNT